MVSVEWMQSALVPRYPRSPQRGCAPCDRHVSAAPALLGTRRTAEDALDAPIELQPQRFRLARNAPCRGTMANAVAQRTSGGSATVISIVLFSACMNADEKPTPTSMMIAAA